RDDPDVARAAAEIALSPQNAVVRRRLDRTVKRSRCAGCHRIQCAERDGIADASAQLCRTENGGRRGRACIAVRAEQLRCASDATRVEQTFGIAVDCVAVETHRVASLPFDEERTLLAEEGLERAEVEHGWICLDLTEVRIDRGS